MKIQRIIPAVASLALVGAGIASPAYAGEGPKDGHGPKVTIEKVNFTVKLKDTCNFPVTLHGKGTSRITTYKNGNVKTENLADSRFVVKRDGTHKKFKHSAEGTWFDRPIDKDTFVSKTTGNLVVWTEGGKDKIGFPYGPDRPGIFLFEGRTKFTVDNAVTPSHIEFLKIHTHVTDVCKMLSKHHRHHH